MSIKNIIVFIAVAAIAVTLAAFAGDASAASPMRYCGPSANGLGVLANKVTTCPFAKKVANVAFQRPTVKYNWGYGPKAGTIKVYSSATHKYVKMYCRMIETPDSPYQLCTGGKGARVEVRS